MKLMEKLAGERENEFLNLR